MSKHPMTKRVFEDAWNQALYDLGRDEQLEQCIAWLDNTHCDDPQETATRLRQAMRPTQEDNPMTRCKYWDSGWCYAGPDVETNDVGGDCVDPTSCPYLVNIELKNAMRPQEDN